MNRKCQIRPQDVVSMYSVQHLSPSEIARLAGVTRQAVWKTLRQNGVVTHKGPGGGTRVKVRCDYCGIEYELTRARWRNAKEHFCDDECYYASRENPQYFQSRQGQRVARVIVSQHFNLQSEHVVHHKDGNNKNNDIINLSVYVSNGDHIKATHHHNSIVRPVWDGAEVLRN